MSTSSTKTRCGRIGHWRSTLRRDASRCSGCRASESTASRCQEVCIMSIGGPHEVLPPHDHLNRFRCPRPTCRYDGHWLEAHGTTHAPSAPTRWARVGRFPCGARVRVRSAGDSQRPTRLGKIENLHAEAPLGTVTADAEHCGRGAVGILRACSAADSEQAPASRTPSSAADRVPRAWFPPRIVRVSKGFGATLKLAAEDRDPAAGCRE